MKNKYYNNYELSKISTLTSNKKYEEALNEYQKYIIKYPND